MNRRRQRFCLTSALAGLVLAAGAPAFGAGFSIFEQGSKAMGMAGAFTAQADDGSAMFHNIAGIGFIKERRIDGGLTIIRLDEATFEGADPFPGSGVREEMDTLTFYPPHGYFIKPLNDRLTFGFAANSPFGLTTRWANKDTYTGRFLNLRAELRVVDLNVGVGWQVSDELSLGLGIIGRFSDVELLRRVPAVNPFTGNTIDAASVLLSSDVENGVGFNAGILHKPTPRFSWGFNYRSKIEVDYNGKAVFEAKPTGNPQLDAIIATQIPFDQDLPVATGIEFPDTAMLGFAFGLTKNVTLETDVVWTGWSSFDRIVLDFSENPQFSSVIPENYEDAYSYRLGVNWRAHSGREWRFGYVFDETPQPDETVGPLLPDADRNGFTAGVGLEHFDAAIMILPFEERTTTVNQDNYNGTYSTDIFLLGLTFKL